jgi:hypothetical protein
MANQSNQSNQSNQNETTKKNSQSRSNNDLEVLKMILDADPVLKRKVMRFMQKNYARVLPQGGK